MSTLQKIRDDNLVIPLLELKKDRELVTEIQERLHDLGLYSYGTNDPDGLWGAKTEQGLDQFCKAVNLNNFDTGLFGHFFAKALIEATKINPPNSPFDVPTWWRGGTRDDLAKAVARESATQGITLRDQVCYIMATIQHETANTFKPIAEYGGKRRSYAPYYGRGYVQLTHKFNYEKYKVKLGINFVEFPDKVMEPATSLFIIVDGMKNGVFTGKKLNDFITPSRTDFVGARWIVNGTDKANLIAGYAKTWKGTSLF
jgi:hypothetical protein